MKFSKLLYLTLGISLAAVLHMPVAVAGECPLTVFEEDTTAENFLKGICNTNLPDQAYNDLYVSFQRMQGTFTVNEALIIFERLPADFPPFKFLNMIRQYYYSVTSNLSRDQVLALAQLILQQASQKQAPRAKQEYNWLLFEYVRDHAELSWPEVEFFITQLIPNTETPFYTGVGEACNNQFSAEQGMIASYLNRLDVAKAVTFAQTQWAASEPERMNRCLLEYASGRVDELTREDIQVLADGLYASSEEERAYIKKLIMQYFAL